MIQFYAPDIAINPVLPESDSQHCVRVLRARQGDTIEVIDGKGHRYTCRLIDAHPKRAMVEITECHNVPLCWSYELTVAVAPTKLMDRMEWLVEKLTEIGVNRIVPIRCTHSERKELKTERLEKIAISAMKQSLKTVMPQILPLTNVGEFIASCQSQQRFIAYCDVDIPRQILAKQIQPNLDTAIMIGPEGDFTTDEIQAAFQADFHPVSLGDNRLRTETAALVAADTVHIINQFH